MAMSTTTFYFSFYPNIIVMREIDKPPPNKKGQKDGEEDMSEYVLDPTALMEDFAEAEVNEGFTNSPLPKGVYPFECERIVSKNTTRRGVPQVGVLLRVYEGANKGRTMIHNLYLDASPVKRDEDGNDVMRTDEEKSKARRGAIGRVKGFLKAVGLPEKNAVTASPDNPVEYLSEFFGLDNLPGTRFIGSVTVQGDRNNLSANYHISHAEHGYAKWQEKNGAETPF